MTKALIFGVNGQDGFYLSELLQKHNVDVVGVSRKKANLIGDVANHEFVEDVISRIKPEYIFNFAANSTTSHDALFENHQTISTGTLNILESVRVHSPQSKVFISGSAMQFENTGRPIDEKTPFEASSPYSVARIQSTYAGRYYRSTFGTLVYIGYFFNHDSPLRTERHVNQKITSFVKNIAHGNAGKLELGNIDVKKEFNYAGDVAEAIWTLMSQSAIFETVIGSGEVYSIREWASYCFGKINKNYKDYLQEDTNYIPEYSTLISNPQLIKSLGWKPKVDFYQLADLMLGDL